MPKLIKIDFYRVQLPSSCTRSFEQLIAEMASSPDDETRNVTYNHEPVRLQQAVQQHGCWVGDMVKIRMEGIPPVTSLRGEQEDLDLDDDEGLGEETAFVYEPNLSVLVIQRNRYGVSTAAFVYYIQSKSGISPIVLEPIVCPDGLDRMVRLQHQRKLEIGVAGMQEIPEGCDDLSVETTAKLAQHYRAPVVHLSLSMGRQPGALSAIWPTIQAWLGLRDRNPEEVTRLVLTGKENEDGPTEVMDLLEDRMVDVGEVTLDASRKYSRESRQAALLAALARRRGDLDRLFALTGGR